LYESNKIAFDFKNGREQEKVNNMAMSPALKTGEEGKGIRMMNIDFL